MADYGCCVNGHWPDGISTKLIKIKTLALKWMPVFTLIPRVRAIDAQFGPTFPISAKDFLVGEEINPNKPKIFFDVVN